MDNGQLLWGCGEGADRGRDKVYVYSDEDGTWHGTGSD